MQADVRVMHALGQVTRAEYGHTDEPLMVTISIGAIPVIAINWVYCLMCGRPCACGGLCINMCT